MQFARRPSRPARPGLLDVLLEGGGRLVVEDVADVVLVDAETEGVRGHHDRAAPAPHEAVLLLLAIAGVHLAVIAVRRGAEAVEQGVDLVHLAGRGAVDDPGSTQTQHEAHQRAQTLIAAALQHVECEVRAMRRACDDLGIAHSDEALDGASHLLGGGGRERQHRRGPEPTQALADLEVGRTEVVAPLGDAVRLVDGGQRETGLPERAHRVFRGEGLRGGHHQQRAALGDALERGLAIASAHRAVEAHHRHLVLEELFVLIAHQRQERGDHEHGLRQHHGRDLVTGGLSEAGGQHHEDVAPGQHGVDDATLLAVEPRDAEAPGGALDRVVGVHRLGVEHEVERVLGLLVVPQARRLGGGSKLGRHPFDRFRVEARFVRLPRLLGLGILRPAAPLPWSDGGCGARRAGASGAVSEASGEASSEVVSPSSSGGLRGFLPRAAGRDPRPRVGLSFSVTRPASRPGRRRQGLGA